MLIQHNGTPGEITSMDVNSLLAVALGVGLAASAGFRVFVPLFAASVAGHYGVLPLSGAWLWLGSPVAMIVLGVAVIVESASYLVPYVDHVLDLLAVPLAGAAGTLLVMTQTAGLDPALSWGLALIGGGGTAMAISGATAGGRLASTATTGGLANPVYAAGETGTAIGLSVLSLFLPVVAVGVGLLLLLLLVVWWLRRRAPVQPQG